MTTDLMFGKADDYIASLQHTSKLSNGAVPHQWGSCTVHGVLHVPPSRSPEMTEPVPAAAVHSVIRRPPSPVTPCSLTPARLSVRDQALVQIPNVQVEQCCAKRAALAQA
jgi:hypothetical protein